MGVMDRVHSKEAYSFDFRKFAMDGKIMGLIGALPARFRRPRVLIVGCGDVGSRVAQLLTSRVRLLALTSSPSKRAAMRAEGVVPLLGNLDQPASLHRLAGLAQYVLHLAPPPTEGETRHDPRTRALLQALARRSAPVALVYGSTTGVYGDCAGQWVDETRAVNPQTARAQRRVDAERHVRSWGRSSGVASTVLRIPGIYGHNREGGPRERLQQGMPALAPQDDVYTNHIHADDLARACMMALWHGRPGAALNVTDDTDLKMGDYLDVAAQLFGLPKPPRVSREQAAQVLSPMVMSFMSESRRLNNERMKTDLGLRLRYPTVEQGLLGQASF